MTAGRRGVRQRDDINTSLLLSHYLDILSELMDPHECSHYAQWINRTGTVQASISEVFGKRIASK